MSARYTLDGTPVDLVKFIADNAEVDADQIRALKPGEEIRFGGGAAPIFTLRREASPWAGEETYAEIPTPDVIGVLGTPMDTWPGDEVLKWSGPFPIPSVGDLVSPGIAYRGVSGWGALKVLRFGVSHGFLYLLCEPTKWPRKVPRKGEPVWVAGVDLIERGAP